MATPDRVLDITTNHDRPTVRIDEVDYLLRTSNDLTLDVYKTLERVTPRLSALLLLEALTPAQGSELGQLLDQACRIALVAPAAVHEKLGDVNRLGIYQVFMELLTPSLLRVARAAEQEAAPHATGPKPSRVSSGSIPAPAPKPGSPRRRSASSGRA